MIFNLFRSPKRLSDGELIDRYKSSGHTKYVGELYQRYAQLIASVCLKYLGQIEMAEDAAMDVFEIMVKDLKQHKVLNPSNWLFTISKNHSLKLKRKAQKLISADAYNISLEDFMEIDNPDTLLEKEISDRHIELLILAISKLKDDQRTCIELFYLSKQSYKDIALNTGIDIKKIKSHIQNGKRKLKIDLEQKIGTDT